MGQTSAQTTLALDKSACSKTRFDFYCDVPSVSSLSMLIQVSPSFKTKLPQERAGGVVNFTDITGLQKRL